MKHNLISEKQNITAITILMNSTSKRSNVITFLP